MTVRKMDGILVVDKRQGITSRGALNKAWGWLPWGNRVGHAGTLDPMATGVLLVCAGQATRLVEWLQMLPKTYRAEILFGAVSSSDDADGLITQLPPPVDPGIVEVQQALDGFVGTISQTPPAVSAVKVDGRRAHERTRRGEAVELAPRAVTIHCIDLLGLDWPRMDIRVECGKGTYIRSLARDLGVALGTGAHLTRLCRERVGPFTQAEAIPLSTPIEEARMRLQPLARGVESLPSLVLEGEVLDKLLHGVKLTAAELGKPLPVMAERDTLVVLNEGRLRMLASWHDGRLHPRKVFLDE